MGLRFVISLIISSISIAAAQTDQAQAPRISAPYSDEIRKLSAQGLRVKEAIEINIDGPAGNLAVVFERTKPRAPNESYEFRIFERGNSSVTTIFRRADFFFSFPPHEVTRLNASDFNGDGFKEIVVQSSSGGNCWSCNPTEIYRVKNHTAELIGAAPIERIVDLDGDGKAELLVTDARWEVYSDLSHAAAPSSVMIYAWRNGKYVYASRDFSSYCESEIDRLKGEIAQARAQITNQEFSDDGFVGRSLSLAITRAHQGFVERAIGELQNPLNSNVISKEQQKRRAAILEDFKSGASAKKLRQMKYGDPLPF